MKEYCLTTKDNPFDPFSDFVKWYNYDIELGHNCCGLLALFSESSSQQSEKDFNDATEAAIDFIIFHDLTGYYVKTEKEIEPKIIKES